MNIEKRVIPYRIKQARVSRGLSMVELSELVSVSKQAISQYEMGKNDSGISGDERKSRAFRSA